MSDKQAKFLPFSAINEFMLPDYRLHIIQTLFARFNDLPGERRSAINGMLKRHLQIPGFRNSLLAPPAIKARAAVSLFEQRPDFTGQVLQGWSDLNAPLRQNVHDFLKAREWEVLPAGADRTRIPGFIMEWPEGQDYDVLGQAYAEMYPGEQPVENDLRLMIVWIAGRLPFGMYEEDEEE